MKGIGENMVYFLMVSFLSTVAAMWLYNYWMANPHVVIQQEKTLLFSVSALLLSATSLMALVKPFPLAAQFFDDLVLGFPEYRILMLPFMLVLVFGAYGGLLASIVLIWRKLTIQAETGKKAYG
ncbi:TPA: hypothetical protein RQN23_000683 [Aeromonas veronii]|nr:hypothetical protein [Aeromonas veronii]